MCKLFVLPVSLTALLSPFLNTSIFLQARIVHPLTFAVRLSDKNECALKTHNCAANAACENTKGSFNCICYSGFTGNGTVCNGEMHTVRLLSSMVFMNCSSLGDLTAMSVNNPLDKCWGREWTFLTLCEWHCACDIAGF